MSASHRADPLTQACACVEAVARLLGETADPRVQTKDRHDPHPVRRLRRAWFGVSNLAEITPDIARAFIPGRETSTSAECTFLSGRQAKFRRERCWKDGTRRAPGPKHLRVGSGLQFLQLALDQVFGVLRITSCKWSQPDGSTTLWDDHEVKPRHQETLHRDVVDVSKRDDCRSSLTRDLGANELDTVAEDPQTLVPYGRYLPC
jgi:hypothetical protein